MNKRGQTAASCIALAMATGTVMWTAAPVRAAEPTAQSPRKQIAGAEGARFRFHGGSDALGFSYVAPQGRDLTDDGGPDGPSTVDPAMQLGEAALARGPSYNRIGLGIGRSTLADDGLTVLHPTPGWSLGFGAMFSEYRAVAGARLHIAFDSVDSGEDGPRVGLVSGQFVPYIRWLTRRGRRVRPYVEFRGGLGGGTLRRKDGDTFSALRTIYPTVGLEAGASVFLVDYFSLEVGAGADYFAPFGRGVADDGSTRLRSDWLRSADVINAALTLGFSVWFA